MREYFNQQFLFEDIAIDSHEYPCVEIQYTKNGAVPIPFVNGRGHEKADTSFLLSSLMEITDEKEWQELLSSIRDNNAVFLIDDIHIVNKEVEPYKVFYLKTYYYWLSINCGNCFVYQMFK